MSCGSEARVCIVAGSIPPVFSGSGLRAFRYACRLHSRGRLAFIVTERPARDAASEARLHAEEEIPPEKVLRLPHRPFTKRYDAQEMAEHKAGFLFQAVRIWWSVFHVLLMRRLEYDVVYGFGAGSRLPLYATVAAKLLGKKAVLSITLLGTEDPLTMQQDPHRLRRWFRTRAFSLADACISISPPITEACAKAGVPTHKVWEIPNPVDRRLFAQCYEKDRKSLRNDLGIGNETFALVFVGSVIERKGVDLLVEAMGRLCRTHDDMQLFVIGSCAAGSEDKRRFLDGLREKIGLLGLVDRVRFVGLTSSVSLYMKACDVFIFPSRSEGFPNVLVEAMASGIPVIACPMSGVAHYIITHEVDGLVVDHTAEAIAAAVEKLHCAPDYRGRLATNALRTVFARFSTEVIDAKYDRVYTAVLTAKDSQGGVDP